MDGFDEFHIADRVSFAAGAGDGAGFRDPSAAVLSGDCESVADGTEWFMTF
jgi:hypothetical protein